MNSKLLTSLLLASSVLVGGALVSSNADAQIRLQPGTIARFINWTYVKGTIKVPPPPTGDLTGFNCGDLMVTSSSTTMVQGSLFQTPKWTRSAVATGNWAAGSCSYSMAVPPGQAFNMAVGSSMVQPVLKCYLVGLNGNLQAANITVPFNTTKVQDFSVTGVTCINEQPPG
jgi:hypothetical protein